MQQDITPRMSIGTRRFVHPVKLQELNETQEKVPFRSISTGRGHVIGLARDGRVWHWSNHITLQRVSLPLERDEKVVQVVANWNYSSVLTDRGALFIIPKPDWIIPSQAQVEPAATTIVAPRIDFSSLYPGEQQDEIVQLTGLDGYTLALTRSGRVLKLATGHIEEFSHQPTHHVQELTHFGAKNKEEVNERDGSMKRFITGNFDNFAVYTKDGRVLLGKVDATSETQPEVLPGLQNRDICKVSFGDYHCGAVTNGGKLLTWGNFSSGALGHGPDYKDIHKSTPTVVEALNDMYVFAIGFGGWQSSVLAIPSFSDDSNGRTEASKSYTDDDSGNFIRTDI